MPVDNCSFEPRPYVSVIHQVNFSLLSLHFTFASPHYQLLRQPFAAAVVNWQLIKTSVGQLLESQLPLGRAAAAASIALTSLWPTAYPSPWSSAQPGDEHTSERLGSRLAHEKGS